MPFCKNCGSPVTNEAEFCRNCGTKVNVSSNQGYQDAGYQNVQGYQNAGYQPQQEYQNSGYQTQQGYVDGAGYYQSPGGYQPPVPPPQSKKSNAGLIVGVAAVIVFVVIVIACSIGNFLAGDNGIVVDNGVINSQQQGGEQAETDAPPATQEVEEENKEYQKGTFTDTTYESEFIGVRYQAPSGWSISSESELSSMPLDPVTTWELQTTSSIDGSNVVIAVEELPSKYITTNLYLNSLKSRLKSDMSLSDDAIKKGGSATIAGKSYETLSYSSTTNGVAYTQTFYVRKVEDRMIAFMVTTPNKDEQPILRNFVAY